MTMKSPAPRKAASYASILWTCFCALFIVAIAFLLYVWTEKRIDRANELRYASRTLVDELRQSSDDLTRMARTYVATGDAQYRKNYQEIIDIRDGKQARPQHYDNVYWDLVIDQQRRPTAPGKPVALMALIQQTSFTPAEISLLTSAKDESDRLTAIENKALAMRDFGGDDPQAIAEALSTLYDDTYHRAKAAIMQPIAQVNDSVERRTAEAVRATSAEANLARAAFLLVALMLLALMWRAKRMLDTALGSPVERLRDAIERMGRGDVSEPLPVAPGAGDSVWGWLAGMQRNLSTLDDQRALAMARTQRVGRLYAALSQCNQAIVRSTSEQELYDDICGAVVTYGGMSMAWIGLIGAAGAVTAVASAGEGTEYLHNLGIVLDPELPEGRGPIGLAYASGEPYWCQDFLHAPETAPWHARAARYGWAASASLPLRRQGRIIGFFAAYSNTAQPFDAEARDLFVEMANDIEFALKNFDHDRKREHTEASLRKSEQHLRTIIETEPECIKVVDANGRLLEMNAAGLKILEADSLEQLQQYMLTDLIMPDYRDAFIALHQRVIGGENGHLEFRVQGLKGGQRWLETHAAPMNGADGDGPGDKRMLLGITRDITDRKLADERIQYLAHFDPLTGLPNRAQLQEHTLHALALARRNRESMALMMLDLDNFKDINDSLGHSVGDGLLCELAKRLRRGLREDDIVARLGGDEFIFVLQKAESKDAAEVARKLMELIDQPFRVGTHDLKVTASIGIALYPADGADMETLLQRADAAMYQVKHAGRHDFRFFTAAMQQRAARHLQLVNALRFALERDQMQVVYQPQVSLPDQRIIGAEALLRWSTPELGVVSPAEFIPAAEESGLILSIGAWVLRQAVRQARAWLDDGLPPLVMAVNLSATQFRNNDLPELITQILQEEGLPPEYLELELTEGVALNDPQGAIAMMNNLHERGVRMSIDDFGTGYSSLSHLKKFKVYKLKIDKSFVRDISTDAEDKAIVSAIINMARSLGLKTIAEGVETAEQLEFLQQQHCNEMQGYYFSKPVPQEEFRQLMLEVVS
jgi:diguanylate cyclase (GGDEF)-like protein/PAS domain S-box-containing protein